MHFANALYVYINTETNIYEFTIIEIILQNNRQCADSLLTLIKLIFLNTLNTKLLITTNYNLLSPLLSPLLREKFSQSVSLAGILSVIKRGSNAGWAAVRGAPGSLLLLGSLS